MADQGYAGSFEISLDDSTWYSVDGANSWSMALSRAMLEITDFDDTAVNRIPGLFDTPCQISGHNAEDDTNGQNALRTAFLTGADVYVRMLPDGVTGFKVTTLVESFNPSSDPTGTVQFSASLASKSAPSAVDLS